MLLRVPGERIRTPVPRMRVESWERAVHRRPGGNDVRLAVELERLRGRASGFYKLRERMAYTQRLHLRNVSYDKMMQVLT